MQKMSVFISIVAFLVISSAAYAEIVSHDYSEPTPYGLSIGHDSQDKLSTTFKTAYLGANHVTDGDMLSLDTSKLEQPHPLRLTAIFDQNNLLQALLAEYDRAYFPVLYAKLKKNYPVVTEKVSLHPLDKAQAQFAHFKVHEVHIFLSAQEKSYYSKLFYKSQQFITMEHQREAQKREEGEEEE